jgi:hypothetical protein
MHSMVSNYFLFKLEIKNLFTLNFLALDENMNLNDRYSTVSTPNHSTSRSSSLVKLSSSISSSKTSLNSQTITNETTCNFTSSLKNDFISTKKNQSENLTVSADSANVATSAQTKAATAGVATVIETDNEKFNNKQSIKSVIINSVENLIYFLFYFFFLNRLQLFFQYLFLNSSINNIDDHDSECFDSSEINLSKQTLTETNYLNNFFVILTILFITLTLYIYIFLIYTHVTRIEMQLAEIQKLFNT